MGMSRVRGSLGGVELVRDQIEARARVIIDTELPKKMVALDLFCMVGGWLGD